MQHEKFMAPFGIIWYISEYVNSEASQVGDLHHYFGTILSAYKSPEGEATWPMKRFLS